jgi:hypothetical protein
MQTTFIVRHLDKMCTICSSCTHDVTLVARMPSHCVGHSHKLRVWTEFHQYVLTKERDNVNLLRFSAYCILCLFFSNMNNVKEVNPYYLLFHFLKSCWPCTDILFQFSYLYFLQFIASIRRCQNFSVIFIFLTFHCDNWRLSKIFSWCQLKHSKCLMWQNLKRPRL